jgi:hypothetical protein
MAVIFPDGGGSALYSITWFNIAHVVADAVDAQLKYQSFFFKKKGSTALPLSENRDAATDNAS